MIRLQHQQEEARAFVSNRRHSLRRARQLIHSAMGRVERRLGIDVSKIKPLLHSTDADDLIKAQDHVLEILLAMDRSEYHGRMALWSIYYSLVSLADATGDRWPNMTMSRRSDHLRFIKEEVVCLSESIRRCS